MAAATQGRGGKRKKSSAKARKRPAAGLDKRKLRAQMEAAVLKKGKAVIAAVIRQAEQGGYLPAKFLFEFAGIAEPFPETLAPLAAAPAETLMEILLGTGKGEGRGGRGGQGGANAGDVS